MLAHASKLAPRHSDVARAQPPFRGGGDPNTRPLPGPTRPKCSGGPMVRDARTRNAWGVNVSPGTRSTPVEALDPHRQRQALGASTPSLPFAVRSRQGRIGRLKAVLWKPCLLLVDAPRVRGGVLLIPFEAIEQIRVDQRTILLR